MERKKILVVCSSNKHESSDFNLLKNNFIKQDLFGDNSNYIFCNSPQGCKYPDNINDNNYDAIWFAGCNCSEWIFKNPDSISKIIEILKPNGIIIFTEQEGFVKYFGGNPDINLTVPFEMLLDNSKRIRMSTQEKNNIIFSTFNEIFQKNIINNHITYTFKNLDTIGGYKKQKIKTKKNKKGKKGKKGKKSKKSKKYI
jgi:hypothetical protein